MPAPLLEKQPRDVLSRPSLSQVERVPGNGLQTHYLNNTKTYDWSSILYAIYRNMIIIHIIYIYIIYLHMWYNIMTLYIYIYIF